MEAVGPLVLVAFPSRLSSSITPTPFFWALCTRAPWRLHHVHALQSFVQSFAGGTKWLNAVGHRMVLCSDSAALCAGLHFLDVLEWMPAIQVGMAWCAQGVDQVSTSLQVLVGLLGPYTLFQCCCAFGGGGQWLSASCCNETTPSPAAITTLWSPQLMSPMLWLGGPVGLVLLGLHP
jgi:hypothetical protein